MFGNGNKISVSLQNVVQIGLQISRVDDVPSVFVFVVDGSGRMAVVRVRRRVIAARGPRSGGVRVGTSGPGLGVTIRVRVGGSIVAQGALGRVLGGRLRNGCPQRGLGVGRRSRMGLDSLLPAPLEEVEAQADEVGGRQVGVGLVGKELGVGGGVPGVRGVSTYSVVQWKLPVLPNLPSASSSSSSAFIWLRQAAGGVWRRDRGNSLLSIGTPRGGPDSPSLGHRGGSARLRWGTIREPWRYMAGTVPGWTVSGDRSFIKW